MRPFGRFPNNSRTFITGNEPKFASSHIQLNGDNIGPTLEPRGFWSSANATSLVGPATVFGGSTIIYSVVFRSPTTSIGPLSVLYMLLLAIQYSIQPRVSKAFIDNRTNKKTVAMVEEISKAAMATILFAASHSRPTIVQARSQISPLTFVNWVFESMKETLKDWTFSSSVLVAGLPAVLYAVQGVLSYSAFQNLDSVTFNGLSQTKTLSAALCCYLVLGKGQSALQILALAMLLLSSLIFQGIIEINLLSNSKYRSSEKEEYSVKSIKSSETKEENRVNWFTLGVAPCLAASFLSGLSGALSQKGLQMTGSRGRDPFFYTVEVSLFSALFLLLTFVPRKNNLKDSDAMDKGPGEVVEGPFAHWTWKTFIPVLIKAGGGVLTALVHKHAGSVVKGFSLMLGLVLAGFVQSILDGKELSANQIIGTLLVMLSGWLHLTNPAI